MTKEHLCLWYKLLQQRRYWDQMWGLWNHGGKIWILVTQRNFLWIILESEQASRKHLSKKHACLVFPQKMTSFLTYIWKQLIFFCFRPLYTYSLVWYISPDCSHMLYPRWELLPITAHFSCSAFWVPSWSQILFTIFSSKGKINERGSCDRLLRGLMMVVELSWKHLRVTADTDVHCLLR